LIEPAHLNYKNTRNRRQEKAEELKDAYQSSDDEKCSERKFQCELCLKFFSRADHLTRHEKGVHKIAPNESDYEEEKKKKKKKTYKCEICHKFFQRPYGLSRHLRDTHMNARPSTEKVEDSDYSESEFEEGQFHCFLCNRAFVSNRSLTRHKQRLVHKREERLAMQAGGNASSEELEFDSDLEEGRYECQHCHKKFVSRRNVIRHENNLHGSDKPYLCAKCGESFARSDYLLNHMRSQHEGTAEDDGNDGDNMPLPHRCASKESLIEKGMLEE